MNYNNVVAAVFTPLEFGTVGLSEDQALKDFGEDAVEIYHTKFKPLEWNFLDKNDSDCYVKVVV